MVQTSTVFELGDQKVAELVISIGDSSGRIECVLQDGQVIDYTITFEGSKELREKIEKEAIKEMNKLAKTV
ncbi:hypothetical protein LC087_18950 (plasmid) [Bacillus carboniphilus]|uniref:Uncharacterized protein n=1 Tax=Bacillus carboniphilus TaxID=86663 RepID=A0ABY9JYC8_9BACI|nr:hypothetical protein [Bacillus carboniphilus]WLR44389.1 hypothetical protein LC087_18950 [Bacillus carboniphilus]